MKKLIYLILIIILCCSLCSCSNEVRYGLVKEDLTKAKREAIEVIGMDDEDGHYFVEKIIYNGEEYFPCDLEIFSHYINDSENDILLSWNGTTIFQYAYTSFYFSDVEEEPLFIYSLTGPGNWQTFFKKGYDYKADIFVIEGTDIEAPFFDWHNPSKYFDAVPSEATDVTEIILQSKTNSRIGFPLKIYQVNSEWYSQVVIYTTERCVENETKLSNKMVEKLKAHNIIE